MTGKLLAEAIGTFWLVLGGCGSAVLAAAYPDLGIGFTGVSLAFGLTVLSMATAIGHISGCHLNPAVTAGLVASGRFPAKDMIPYWIAQVVGGIAGAGILYLVASGLPGFDAVASGFASNGYGDHSPSAVPGVTGYGWQVSIPVTNTSVNPARSTATAVFVGGWAVQQLWLFWVAPIVGGIVGGLIYRSVADCAD